MLQEIIDLQQRAVKELTNEYFGTKKEITFRSPTGSGKTYMMADFMNKILEEEPNTIFLVSSLSNGDLARQNYEKFLEYHDKGNFPKINPYLINSNISGEERLFIPTEYNVYLLPRDLYKKGGRLMSGSMQAFLNEFYHNFRKVVLIKDECHIATKNLDDISGYFAKTINFSATPKLSRGQNPDVEIKNADAENAKLIKTIEWDEEEGKVVEKAVSKFKEIKENYRNLLGVNPCLIIQISNKDKADEELKNKIMPVLNANPELKWMLIVDKDKECDTNDDLKKKKMPISKWKDYAKSDTATIDIIIFKMVITEGWDIPRACMLCQVRDTKSRQLDEQVVGRVRRNPRLLDFEKLSVEAQKLAMTAWAWGLKDEEQKKVLAVKLQAEPHVASENFKVKTTKLKKLTEKSDFDLAQFLAEKKTRSTSSSIFELAKKLKSAENEVRDMIYDYASDYSKWWQVAEFSDEISKKHKTYKNDYAESMELGEEVSFYLSSHYTDNGNYLNIADWVWRRKDGAVKYSFDSEAEREWAEILKDLSKQSTQKIKVGKTKKAKDDSQIKVFEEQVNAGEEKDVYLWGKNYLPNSNIKFEYYANGVHSSFPDFVMKDNFGRVHIFEVKSVNKSSKHNFDTDEYDEKINELKKCYLHASKLTEQIFYLPITKGDTWQIHKYENGQEGKITKEQFESFVRAG